MGYDRKELEKKEVQEKIAEDLAMWEPIPWNTGVNTHEAIVTERLRAILKERCPKKETAGKQHIGEETFKAVALKTSGGEGNTSSSKR